MRVTLVSLFLLTPTVAAAQPADDGYCDYVKGAASANAATLMAPQLFGQFGYIEQAQFSVTPDTEPNDLRAIAGIRYSFTNIFAGKATTSRADADCRRHRAQLQLQAITQQIKDTTAVRAIGARLDVLDKALVEADKLLATSNADLDARRITTQEAVSTRMRVEDLRSQAAQARRDLAALPSPDLKGVDALLAQYRAADADLERSDAKLRTIQAYDIGVRAGADRFVNGTAPTTRYFAVVEVGFNLGALWLGGANKRAASGRARFAKSTDPFGNTTSAEQLRTVLEVQLKRQPQVAALVADLDRQLQALSASDSIDAKRFRETIWFDSIKAKAELAYLNAHIAALKEAIGSR